MLRKCIRNVILICIFICLAGAIAIAADRVQPEINPIMHDPTFWHILEVIMGIVLSVLAWSLTRVVADFDKAVKNLDLRMTNVETQQKLNIEKLAILHTHWEDCENCTSPVKKTN